MKYIVLLRGINISGKNKIAMTELKSILEENGYKNIKIILNSGNVIFENDSESKEILSKNIFEIIKKYFELEISVFVMTEAELEDVLNNSPNWWIKTASTCIKDKITIRTTGTMKKVLELCKSK